MTSKLTKAQQSIMNRLELAGGKPLRLSAVRLPAIETLNKLGHIDVAVAVQPDAGRGRHRLVYTVTKRKVNPVMPCGYNREGVKLMDRVRHYRVCPHPACQERLAAFEDMRGRFAAGLKDGSIKAGSK